MHLDNRSLLPMREVVRQVLDQGQVLCILLLLQTLHLLLAIEHHDRFLLVPDAQQLLVDLLNAHLSTRLFQIHRSLRTGSHHLMSHLFLRRVHHVDVEVVFLGRHVLDHLAAVRLDLLHLHDLFPGFHEF